MKNFLLTIDKNIIVCAKRYYIPFARLALFVIFFWFGALKALGLSPASELVENLFSATFLSSWLAFDTFFLLFSFFEMAIGLLFLFPKLTRIAFIVLIAHMIMTAMPLIMLPTEVWTAPFAPTLEGQYIIKNMALIALALSMVASLKPLEQN